MRFEEREGRVSSIFQQMTMPYLAARVPSDWQVIHVNEEAEDIDWTDQPDIVGITFHTPILRREARTTACIANACVYFPTR